MLSLVRYLKGSFAVLLLLFLAVPVLCAVSPMARAAATEREAVLDVYSQMKPDDTILNSEHFIVIDDFNTGRFTERRGATWRIKSPVIGALDLSVDKVDARSQTRGYSLKADANLMPGEEAYFESFLNRIDVSKAEALVFKARFEAPDKKPFSGGLSVVLKDARQRELRLDAGSQIASKEDGWHTVVLPLEASENLDADHLSSLSFMIAAKETPVKGTIRIDEISFFNRGNVTFESYRDNLAGFPEKVHDDKRREWLKKQKKDKKLLREIAKDTWAFFENARDSHTDLIVDHIRLGEAPLIADYTSPTNIAMDLLSTITAMDLEFISEARARERVSRVLASLDKMSRYDGFFYNFYNTKKLSIERKYISSVDSGWLAVALVVVRQAFPGELADKATAFLDDFDFGIFLDPENNHLVVGFDVPLRNFGQYHYGLLVTEARATSLYAIGKGDLDPEHWWFLYRTLPEVWEWQNQKPQGRYVTRDGVEYFQGYYQKDGKKFVPSWGGSLFEVLMPTLVLKEKELAGKGLGLNNRIITELHRDYCLKEKGYPVWGMSPCAVSNGRSWAYREYGVPDLGAKGYPDWGVVTPHVSFLALDSLPEDAIRNIRRLLDYEIYGEYGFYDSVDLRRGGQVNPQYLSLDQGMILVAIGNYLTDGAIQKRFHEDPVGRAAEPLLGQEAFFEPN